MIAARHRTAEAQVLVHETMAGISEELDGLGLSLQKAELEANRLQAHAAAPLAFPTPPMYNQARKLHRSCFVPDSTCAILAHMNDARAIRLASRLSAWGLGPLLAGLLEAGAGPLGFLAAQSLYLAQPALGLFADEDRLAEWAEWLDDPAGLNALASCILHPGEESDR